MAKKSALGRGLDALIPGGGDERPRGVQEVALEQIRPNPRQPRDHFEPDQLEELAASIRLHGVLQPLIVSEAEAGEGYVLIAGERRLLAARQAGLTQVPVIVRPASEQERLELALIENVQRADLNALEAAEAYRQLATDFNLSHDEIAARVGKNRVTVSNTLRLLKLAPAVQTALRAGEISEGHARCLLALPTSQAQAAALQTVMTQSLNVRQTEELVRRLSGQRRDPARPEPAPEILALEERLRASLGTKVSLKRTARGGSLVIHFYSDEELDALIAQITQTGPG